MIYSMTDLDHPRHSRWILCSPQAMRAKDKSDLTNGATAVEFSQNKSGTITAIPYQWSRAFNNWVRMSNIVVQGMVIYSENERYVESARVVWIHLRKNGYDIHP